jgi:hypothetical protein
MAARLQQRLGERGEAPADLLDVRDFITATQKARKRAPAPA